MPNGVNDIRPPLARSDGPDRSWSARGDAPRNWLFGNLYWELASGFFVGVFAIHL